MVAAKKLKLQVEMVPRSSWYVSLHRLMPDRAWDKLRKEVHERNGSKCQHCGSSLKLQCHELWKYDGKTHTQKLAGLGTICNMCHHATHFGLAVKLASQNYLDINAVVRHFLQVNACDLATFDKHQKKAYDLFEKRSQYEWKVDFGEYAHLIKSRSQKSTHK